jgi:ABC-type sulfate transport system permease component
MPLDRISLALGLEIAAVVTVLATLLGVSLAWILQNREFPGKPAVSVAANLAVALPAPLVGYFLLAQHATPSGLVAAGVVATMPLLVRSARAAFAALGPAFGQAARSMGTPEWLVFARIELPLVVRPILHAAGLALARVLLELAAAHWLAEAKG